MEAFERLWQGDVVVVEYPDAVPRRVGKGDVQRRSLAGVLFPDVLDAGAERLDDLSRMVRRSVVDDDDLLRLQRLTTDARLKVGMMTVTGAERSLERSSSLSPSERRRSYPRIASDR